MLNKSDKLPGWVGQSMGRTSPLFPKIIPTASLVSRTNFFMDASGSALPVDPRTFTAPSDGVALIILRAAGGGGADSGSAANQIGGDGASALIKSISLYKGQQVTMNKGIGGAAGVGGDGSVGGDTTALLPDGRLIRAYGGWGGSLSKPAQRRPTDGDINRIGGPGISQVSPNSGLNASPDPGAATGTAGTNYGGGYPAGFDDVLFSPIFNWKPSGNGSTNQNYGGGGNGGSGAGARNGEDGMYCLLFFTVVQQG